MSKHLRLLGVVLVTLLISAPAATMPPGGDPNCWSPDCGVCMVVNEEEACEYVPMRGSCYCEFGRAGICSGCGHCETTAFP